jgi:hypothetical protein
MPVEIRELVIKATVDSGGGSAAAGASGSGGGTNASPGDELIKTCVEKVLEILKEKNER